MYGKMIGNIAETVMTDARSTAGTELNLSVIALHKYRFCQAENVRHVKKYLNAVQIFSTVTHSPTVVRKKIT